MSDWGAGWAVSPHMHALRSLWRFVLLWSVLRFNAGKVTLPLLRILGASGLISQFFYSHMLECLLAHNGLGFTLKERRNGP